MINYLGGKGTVGVSERSLRMESYERILTACEETPRKQTKSILPQFLQNMEWFWECGFALLLGVAERSEFTSDYLLQLATGICSYAFMETQAFATYSLPTRCDLFTMCAL